MAQERAAGGMWTRSVHAAGPRRSRCAALGACVAAAACLLAGRAGAEGTLRLAVEWDKLAALLHGGEAPSSHPSWRPDRDRAILEMPRVEDRGSPEAPRAEATALLEGLQGRGRWSLVARDWQVSRPLMGRLGPTDQVRPGRSKRMVLLRGRLLEGPISPFAQLGIGQWRIDPDMPAMPHDSVPAGQIGVGVEYALASWVSLAFEADCTLLDPAHLDPPDPLRLERPGSGLVPRDVRWVHPPALWGSFLAARARF
jgi:hypothetical protein